MINIDSNTLDWEKMSGLLPIIVQNANTGIVLMLGYMNKEALNVTLESKLLTFYSRSKQRIWQKGETSGNYLKVVEISVDCDQDSLLIQVLPQGPTCHLGFESCFKVSTLQLNFSFLSVLTGIIKQRATQKSEQSYIASLFTEGIYRCAQKVGEEAVETVIAALKQNHDEIINESADLIFHLMVLLEICKINIQEVINCLEERHQGRVKIAGTPCFKHGIQSDTKL